MKRLWRGASGLGTAALCLCARSGLAQDIGEPRPGSEPGANAPSEGTAPPVKVTDAEGNTINITGNITPPTQTTTVYAPPPEGPPSDAHLPSSSRPITDTSRSSDTFDLLPNRGGAATVYGNKDAPAILRRRGGAVPPVHEVKQGDTLWDLCATYFNNPWMWPKIWSYNSQIQNPHWIYPGDQLRMTPGGGPAYGETVTLGGGRGGPGAGGGGPGRGGLINRRPLVPQNTVFLRDLGYIDDPKKDVWGELVGAREEQMLLADGNNVYMILRPGVNARPGQQLTVFNTVRPPANVKGARKPKGQIVAFKGTIRIDHFDPKTRVARGQIVESVDIIERGAKVGPVGRRFDVVPPRPNDKEVWARVLTSLYPHEIMGQYQVAFIDRGERDGLKPGNRLFVVDRGDAWRRTLKTSTKMARGRVRTDVPEHVKVEYTPLHGNEKDFPEEVVGELRILRTRAETSLALVTASRREIEPGDRVVARKGY